MADKQAVATKEAPQAIGPYSQAVRSGGLLYTSGQVALDTVTGQIVAGGIEAQTRQVMKNLQAVIEAGGSQLSQVVKTTVFLADMNDFAAMNVIYAEYLAPEGCIAPARSTVQVSRLPKDALVEVEVVALVP